MPRAFRRNRSPAPASVAQRPRPLRGSSKRGLEVFQCRSESSRFRTSKLLYVALQMLHVDGDLSLISSITSERELTLARITELQTKIEVLTADVEVLKADLGRIDVALDVIAQVKTRDHAHSPTSVPADLANGSAFVPLDLDAIKLSRPDRDSEPAKLIDFVLEAERMLAPSRAERGLSPKEISTEITRVFGRDLNMHKVNGRVWYLFKQKKMSKRDRYYYLPTRTEAVDVHGTSTASDHSTPAETGGQ